MKIIFPNGYNVLRYIKNKNITKMTSRQIPVYTPGNINLPSVRVNVGQIQNPVYVSSYTGNILPGCPTFSTPTDDSSGRNPTYHGGILIGNNIIMCHQQSYNGFRYWCGRQNFLFYKIKKFIK